MRGSKRGQRITKGGRKMSFKTLARRMGARAIGSKRNHDRRMEWL